MPKFRFLLLFLLCVTTNLPIACFGQTNFSMTRIGPNRLLDTPWDLHYGPDDYLWVTERSVGVVVRIDPETAMRDPLIKISDLYSTVSQDGLLGMALHGQFMEGQPYVYLSYTYFDNGRRQKIVRYTYTISDNDGSLSDPITLIDSLPASNDHNSGRLIYGPDDKLYYTIGDQGANQNLNYCNAVLSQFLPTQEQIKQEDWSYYPGKILRLNLDGSIPEDNPEINGVRSHVYSYGHRNAQGIVFSGKGILYADEHGPDTDDEVNVIYAGANYGWPNVAGYKDNQAYDYCNWSSAMNCQNIEYDKFNCPGNAAFAEESSFTEENYRDPLLSMFAVTDDYNFNNPSCSNSWICRPNVAPSSIGFYESEAIPGWKNSILVSSLKRGRVYRIQLDESGTQMIGDTTQHFYTQNRYRDIVMTPDGMSFYVITDEGGRTSDKTGLQHRNSLVNPGAILKFTYQPVVNVKEIAKERIYQVWPNPTADQIQINVKQSVKNQLKADLFTSTGQIIQQNLELNLGNNELRTNHLSPGIYYLRIHSATQSWIEKVVLY